MKTWMHRLLRLALGLAFMAVFAWFYLVPVGGQSIGTPMPVPMQLFDNSGNPLASGTISTYVAGTSTSAVTYSNHTLATQNANPVVLDSAGRATIYLDRANYKFIIANSANVILTTLDNIYSAGNAAYQVALDNKTCDGRISVTSGTPIPDSDVTAATSVYFVPYQGNRCLVYDGAANWVLRTFTELSLSLGSDAINSNYDVFVYDNAGTLALERLAWTNDTARATALALQDGVYVKSGQTTRRYLGTYRTTGTLGQTEDSLTKRFVWNNHHRVRRPVRRLETTDSWTYTTATWRVVNNTTANQINVVVGGAETTIDLTVLAIAENTGASVTMHTGIGEDSVLTPTGFINGQVMSRTDTPFHTSASLSRVIATGYHYYAWLERSAASGTTTWYGDQGAGGVYQTGLSGVIDN